MFTRKVYLFIFSVLVLFGLHDFGMINLYGVVPDFGRQPTACDHLLGEHLLTNKGNITYGDVLRQVYEPLGFQISADPKKCSPSSESHALFPIEKKCRPSCVKLLEGLTTNHESHTSTPVYRTCALISNDSKPRKFHVFAEWLSIAQEWGKEREKAGKPLKAPDAIPEKLADQYTMFGHVPVQSYYFNEILEGSQRTWTVQMVDDLKKLWTEKQFAGVGYSAPETASIDQALTSFKLDGQTGIAIGSLSPWVEAGCLVHGAKKVITVEYATIDSQHPQLEYVHPQTFTKDWKKYSNMDFAISYSSIEHSGLGRFGDPMDPMGDVREMDKISCLLKPGGLLYLGWPFGPDALVFNAHRVYGDLRWPLLAAGYTVVGVFLPNATFHIANTFVRQNRVSTGIQDHTQYVYVLRKDAMHSKLKFCK